MIATVINIQKYCVHDGDGVRTTVFFKGCPLGCTWCHNPESIDPAVQLLFYEERCRGCRACVSVCTAGAVSMEGAAPRTRREKCTACGACAPVCPFDAREMIGRGYTLPELVRIADQDKMFYETSGGGVTLSGGEVMAQDPAFLCALLQALQKKGFHTAVDTCGFAPWERFAAVLPWTNLFLYDVKAMDPARHKRYTGADNALILANLCKLSDAGASLHIRIPVIGNANDREEEMLAVRDFLREIRVEKLSLLPYHRAGSDKRARLGLLERDDGFYTPDNQCMQAYAALFADEGYSVQIGG